MIDYLILFVSSYLDNARSCLDTAIEEGNFNKALSYASRCVAYDTVLDLLYELQDGDFDVK